VRLNRRTPQELGGRHRGYTQRIVTRQRELEVYKQYSYPESGKKVRTYGICGPSLMLEATNPSEVHS